MRNIQIRLPEQELYSITSLMEELHMSKSEIARNALHKGLQAIKMEIALKKYLNEEFTLCRASEFGNVSIQQMSSFISDRGIPYFKYSKHDLERDIKTARYWF